MEKQRKIKMLSIIALVIAVLGVTIAFAALSGTLRINGSGTMDRADWNIYFDNLSNASTKGKGSVIGTPTLEEHGAEISNIKVKLKQPQDSVTYTVDIVNNGDIDAEIDNIVLPTVPNEYKDILDFEVVYTDNKEEPKKGDVLTHTSPNNTRNLTIKISYKDITDESLLPEEEGVINLTYKINYVQKSSEIEEEPSNTSSVSNCTEFTKKDTYSQGDVISICNSSTGKSEDFYVLSDNGETVTALAKYNLLVGNKIEYDQEFNATTTAISTSDPEYGIQSSKTLPNLQDNIELTGLVGFSNNSYWSVDSYPSYVFDSNSNLWQPVQNYKNYLKNTLGKTSVTATLLSYDQAIASGCDVNQKICPSYLMQNWFWLGTAAIDEGIYYIGDLSAFGYSSFDYTGYYIDINYGVRPVITISKSEI